MSRLRVPAGYVVGLVAVALARPDARSIALGMALAVLGETVRLWASGHIEKTQALATGGPYAHTRNPLYFGSLLMALGVGVAAASPWVVGLVAAYFLAFYPAVIREEAAFLRAKFGSAYDDWAAAVPAFFPRIVPAGSRASRFSWERVRSNREWRTLAALPLLGVVLWVRGMLSR